MQSKRVNLTPCSLLILFCSWSHQICFGGVQLPQVIRLSPKKGSFIFVLNFFDVGYDEERMLFLINLFATLYFFNVWLKWNQWDYLLCSFLEFTYSFIASLIFDVWE